MRVGGDPGEQKELPSMVCQLPGDFLTLDFHTNDFGDLLASREDAKRRRKTKAQTSHKNWTTGSMRKSTCRFVSQRGYGPYVKSFGSPKQRSQKFLGSGLLGGFA
jgi:hypothetical protein